AAPDAVAFADVHLHRVGAGLGGAGGAVGKQPAGAAAVAAAEPAAGGDVLGRALGGGAALHPIGDGVAGADRAGQVAGVAGLVAGLVAADAVDAETARALELVRARLPHAVLDLTGLVAVAEEAVLALG